MYSRQMHKGANKQTSLTKTEVILQCLTFVIRLCSEKIPAIFAQLEFEMKLTRGLNELESF